MTLSQGASCASPLALQRAALASLAVLLLMCGFTGRAGVQVVDHATAARIFALHLHGIPGEAQYVETYGLPSPLVHPHCHAPARVPVAQPGPDEVQAAASLAGAVHCDLAAPMLTTPSLTAAARPALPALPAGVSLQPPVPPPQG